MKETKDFPEEMKLDLSKVNIANLNNSSDSSAILAAIDKTAKEVMRDLPATSKKKQRSSKFNFTQPSLIKLPSGGKFYKTDDENIKKGMIEIYPLTVREEEILSTPRFIVDGTATIMVLNNCIASDIDAMDLLMYDYTYLLFYLRKISFSDEYIFDITCPVCDNRFKDGFKISDIEFDELPKDFKEPYKIDLPVSKYTVILSMPRIKHIKEFDKIQSELSPKERREYSGIADMFAIRTEAVIDNNGEIVQKEDWVEFYQSLPPKDRAELTRNSSFDSGVDKVMEKVICPNCESIIGGAIPVNDDFFHFGWGEPK